MKNQPFLSRFRNSLGGLSAAWRSERSFRIHVLAFLGALALLLGLRPSPIWWALVLLHGFLVMGAELFNTALEHALDRIHPERHPAIRIAKDCAAAAVLMASASALATFVLLLLSECRR